MGLFKTHWEAEFEGRRITVDRNEVTRGIRVAVDGETIAEKVVTLVGLADLHGEIRRDGKALPVEATTDWGSTCSIKVDGKALEVKRTG